MRVGAKATASTTIEDEILYGRSALLRVFVSSQMRGGVLDAERMAAASAIEDTGIHVAWYWERDADAGPYCSEGICIGNARTSDGLVLILADELTPITQLEFENAQAVGIPVFIMLKDGASPNATARAFINEQRAKCVTKTFKNESELKSAIVDALRRSAVTHARTGMLAVRGAAKPLASLSGGISTGAGWVGRLAKLRAVARGMVS